jgi:hypothetical protein
MSRNFGMGRSVPLLSAVFAANRQKLETGTSMIAPTASAGSPITHCYAGFQRIPDTMTTEPTIPSMDWAGCLPSGDQRESTPPGGSTPKHRCPILPDASRSPDLAARSDRNSNQAVPERDPRQQRPDHAPAGWRPEQDLLGRMGPQGLHHRHRLPSRRQELQRRARWASLT